MTRLLYAALTGALSIIILLVGSWASTVSQKQDVFESRITTLENHYSRIETKLQDIQNGLVSIDSGMKEQPGWRTHRQFQNSQRSSQ